MKVEQNSISLSLSLWPPFHATHFLVFSLPPPLAVYCFLFLLLSLSHGKSNSSSVTNTFDPILKQQKKTDHKGRKRERERERERERCIAVKTLSGEWIRINCQRDFRKNKITKGEELTVEGTRVRERER